MAKENTEFVVLVDKHNQEIGVEEKLSAHQNGSLHRAFSIFIFRLNHGKLELLLQQRSQTKYHCANLWTNSCCGHPRQGEDIMQAAQRRLQEEMHIATRLEYLDKFYYFAECNNGLVEHELDHVFIGCYQQDIATVNLQEVQAFRWVAVADLALELAQSPDKFTPWFAGAFAVVTEHLTQVGQHISQETLQELSI